MSDRHELRKCDVLFMFTFSFSNFEKHSTQKCKLVSQDFTVTPTLRRRAVKAKRHIKTMLVGTFFKSCCDLRQLYFISTVVLFVGKFWKFPIDLELSYFQNSFNETRSSQKLAKLKFYLCYKNDIIRGYCKFFNLFDLIWKIFNYCNYIFSYFLIIFNYKRDRCTQTRIN